jgi:serine/threonine-protein kinase RsbW
MADQTHKIEGRFDQVAVMSDLIDRQAETAGFQARDRYALQLAVCEALENIIIHGYKGESDNLIEATIETSPGEVHIEIWDDAPPFNPANGPIANEWSDEDPPVGGLGLKIIHKVMDEIRYERKNKRNWLRLSKKLSSSSRS